MKDGDIILKGSLSIVNTGVLFFFFYQEYPKCGPTYFQKPVSPLGSEVPVKNKICIPENVWICRGIEFHSFDHQSRG